MVEGDGKEGKKRKVDFVKWFSDLSNKDIKIAGGKGASLAEMYNNKFPIPPGFIVTADAYSYFIEKAGLTDRIKDILDSFDIEDTEKLEEGARKIREIIVKSKMPAEIEEEIFEAYEILDVNKKEMKSAKGDALGILKTGHEPPFVAVRSSATAEDLADASFAGQQESFLNVKGIKELLVKVKECFASLFTARATYYREKKGFDHLETKLAVVVQKMIDSEKSGVMFSTNPIKADNSILIEAVWGLGEGIVSGRIKPDQYIISPDLENFKVLEEKISKKKEAVTRDSGGKNVIIKLTEERGRQRVLNNYEIKRLAQYGKELEKHYGMPQDIEFAVEGSEIFIVQSRPVTTKAKEAEGEISGEVLLSGLSASPGVASGNIKIIHDLAELGKIKKGDILVTKMTNPDMVVTMQKSAAIITDEGGITSHAAIVSREMGIPAVVGTGNATEKLKEGEVVTVDGNAGKIYEGRGETKLAEVLPAVPTKTKIKVIVDLPEFSERAAKASVKGIGLTRIEGIIASSGKHPIAFKKEGKMEDYIQVLHDGLKKIALPFEEIWIRTSDIRSDEYRHLEGAVKEVEGNPMLGDHGIRFGLRHPEILKAELTAVKELADEFPNKKFGFMFPQVIDVKELKEVKRIAKDEVGMPSNIRMGVMIETPASVQVINDLCGEGLDFVSFGTNDLTQYTLAIDRNNPDVQYLYDEMNPAILNSLSYVIRRCKKYGVETSICGQAGSRPEMVKFLVEQGIDSISVNADAAAKISKFVAKLEESGKAGVSATERGAEGVGVESIRGPLAMESPIAGIKEEVKEQPGMPGTPGISIGEGDKDKEEKVEREEEMSQDIEEVILKELEGGDLEKEKSDLEPPSPEFIAVPEPAPEREPEPEQPSKPSLPEPESEKKEDEYVPSGGKKDDVPFLNDAIPVDSNTLNEPDEKEEMDLSDEGDWESDENNEWGKDLHEGDEWQGDEKIVDIF